MRREEIQRFIDAAGEAFFKRRVDGAALRSALVIETQDADGSRRFFRQRAYQP